MNTLSQILVYLLQTLGGLYLMVVLLRLMLQIARADFYNPMSQFIVKATNPLLMPLRKVIPGLMGIDFASIVLALLVAVGLGQLVLLLSGYGFQNPFHLMAWGAVAVLASLANLLFWALIIMVIASWVAPQSYNPALLLIRQLLAPIMAPFQRLIPPMGGIDLSAIFVLLTLNIVSSFIVPALANSVAMPRGLFLGL